MNATGHYRKVEEPLPGLIVYERLAAKDERGAFEHIFARDAFAAWGISEALQQVNLSTTHKMGAVRGLHYQTPPHAEDKIVSCIGGSIFDVAVDLRGGSPTFRRWYGVTLTPDNRLSVLIPKGFAHGFQCLSADCRTLYLHTAAYAPAADVGINATDPGIAIAWPLAITQRSERDSSWPPLAADFKGITP